MNNQLRNREPNHYLNLNRNWLLPLFFPLLVLYCRNTIMAQDTLSIHTLLTQIGEQQVKQDPFFINGIFPSYVSNKKVYKELRKDNNVFYNAVITYTLRSLRPKLSSADQLIVDSIITRSEKVMGQFKNSKGRESYNFWRTDSAYRLPYLWGIQVKKKDMLEDDQDCTSMCLLSLNTSPSSAQMAHVLMQDYTNNKWNPLSTGFSRYKSYGAYTTWLGRKLPPVIDVCVITNILSFVQTYHLNWSRADSASLDLLLATIKTNDHVTNPIMVSPFYGSTSIILYHLARLMSIRPIPALESIKSSLINDAMDQLKQTNNEFEKIILSTALMKWEAGTAMAGDVRINDIDKSDFPFFLGNIPSIFPRVFQKPLSRNGIGIYYHYCPAYNNVLALEYLVLKNENRPGLVMENKP